MRRWLIAIFTLHVILGVGFFTLGSATADVPRDGTPSIAFAIDGDMPESPSKSHRLSAAPDHGLADAPLDLPELFHGPADALVAGQALGGLPAPTLAKRAQPTLEGPQRPPRARLAA